MREAPLKGLVTRLSRLMGTSATAGVVDNEAQTADLNVANVITSEVEGRPDRHKIVLDIDMPVNVIESSTPGHFHLYIDHELDWEDYQRLLWVMADIGLLEEGYVSSSQTRKYTAVRLPWVKKGDPPPVAPPAAAPCTCVTCRVRDVGRAPGLAW